MVSNTEVSDGMASTIDSEDSMLCESAGQWVLGPRWMKPQRMFEGGLSSSVLAAWANVVT